MKIHKKDYHLVPKEADKGFDPEHNRRIIDEVIADTEKMRVKKQREFSNQLNERTDAVATYLHAVGQGQGESNMNKYFGKKYLMYLRGQDIMQKIQQGLTYIKDGKVIKQGE